MYTIITMILNFSVKKISPFIKIMTDLGAGIFVKNEILLLYDFFFKELKISAVLNVYWYICA